MFKVSFESVPQDKLSDKIVNVGCVRKPDKVNLWYAIKKGGVVRWNACDIPVLEGFTTGLVDEGWLTLKKDLDFAKKAPWTNLQ